MKITRSRYLLRIESIRMIWSVASDGRDYDCDASVPRASNNTRTGILIHFV